MLSHLKYTNSETVHHGIVVVVVVGDAAGVFHTCCKVTNQI